MCYFIPKYLINKINTAIIDHLGIVLTSPLLYRKLYIIGYFIQNKFEIFIFTILNFIHLLVVILIENILDITISPTFVNNETNTFRLPENNLNLYIYGIACTTKYFLLSFIASW